MLMGIFQDKNKSLLCKTEHNGCHNMLNMLEVLELVNNGRGQF